MPEPSRTIAFDAVFNFRDLGGYPTADGSTVRWRRLFRADGLHRLLLEEADQVRALGITTVIDLRTPEEVSTRGRFPEAIADVAYHHLPMFDVEPDWPEDDDSPTYLADRYVEMLESGRASVATALGVLAQPEAYPLVFHCAAGKDRTGILAAVVLGLLGVPDDVIAEDYALSHGAMEVMSAWVSTNMPEFAAGATRYPPSVFGASAPTMDAFIAHVRRAFGGFEGLAADLGVGADVVEGLREQLLTGR